MACGSYFKTSEALLLSPESNFWKISVKLANLLNSLANEVAISAWVALAQVVNLTLKVII